MKFQFCCLLFFSLVIGLVQAGSKLSALRKSILSDYDKNVNPDEQTSVNISISLLDLHYCNHRQVLTTKAWFAETWNDERLSWAPDQFDGIDRIRLLPNEVWLPDITLYNNVEKPTNLAFEWEETTRVVVLSSGTVIFVPPVASKSFCGGDTKPTEGWQWVERSCNLTMGSWTYDQSSVDLNIMDNDWRKPVDITYFFNQRVEIVSTEAIKEDKTYDCCPDEIYPSINFNLKFKTLAVMNKDHKGLLVAP